MKFAEINRKFTETVAAWIAKGYTINTATMSGSQGELAKIDLTDGKEIIRVDMRRTGKPFEKVGDRYYSFEGIEIAVGRITDKVQPNTHDTWSVAWTSHMEVLSSEAFYEIGRQKRDGSKWYGTREEGSVSAPTTRSAKSLTLDPRYGRVEPSDKRLNVSPIRTMFALPCRTPSTVTVLGILM